MINLIQRALEWYQANVNPADALAGFLCLVGTFIFARWVADTSGGSTALLDAQPRRNKMPIYMPFLAISLYVVLRGAVKLLIEKGLPGLNEWQKVFWDIALSSVCALLVIAGIIAAAWKSFARRLKGFGFEPRTIGKDLAAAVVNLVCIWPIITIAVLLTILVNHYSGLRGPEIEKHEMLKTLVLYQQLPVRLSMLIFMIAVGPIFEEMLFRGLFQTLIRGFVPSAWGSIVISSIIFVAAHQSFTHWPAIFVLALCLGYSYEKSGSLFRPIFIHILFNTTNVISTIVSVSL
jgi:membrane protease YdiL (CAAX protease family)